MKCTISECTKKRKLAPKMDYEQLEKQSLICSYECGSWIIKESIQANETLHAITNAWAVRFNNKMASNNKEQP